jgi:hypothetical protein
MQSVTVHAALIKISLEQFVPVWDLLQSTEASIGLPSTQSESPRVS